MLRQFFLAALLAVLIPSAAEAAALPQLPPSRSLPLVLAIEAGRTALDACAAKGSPATVEIVDLNGLAKVVLSADGARTSSFEYDRRKAYTVLHKGMSSRDFGRSLGRLPAHPAPFEGDPNLIQYGGGLPIMRGAVMIGVIVVSGPTGDDDDEACAHAGLVRIAARLGTAAAGSTP